MAQISGVTLYMKSSYSRVHKDNFGFRRGLKFMKISVIAIYMKLSTCDAMFFFSGGRGLKFI